MLLELEATSGSVCTDYAEPVHDEDALIRELGFGGDDGVSARRVSAPILPRVRHPARQ